MANSGWVRITQPTAVNVQVGINGPNASRSIAPLSAAGGGNIFSAWITDANGTDTIFYLVNHSGNDQTVFFKWMASDGTPGNNTAAMIPANQMKAIPASSESGL